MWISPNLFLDQLNAWNWSEIGLRRGPQTFIQCCQEKIQQSPLQYSALFALGQSRMDLKISRTIDLNMRTSQELDFRLSTTSKNNLPVSEFHIFRPTL